MIASTGNVPGRIFISYRREETAYPAGWLYDRLASNFGRDQIFKDVDSIELGDDFVDVITSAVGSCDVLLALIGDRWLTITDPDGRRRLDNPDDFVRLEIEAALERDVRVIPILVEGAHMPPAGELPVSLTKLVRRHALELSPGRFESDIRRLLRALDLAITEAQGQAQEAERAAADRQQQVEQLQRQIREHAAAEDWQAVLAVNDQLAALDPAAADPDALASTAHEQITRRQEAEKAAAERQQQESHDAVKAAELRPGETIAAEAAGSPGTVPITAPPPPIEPASPRAEQQARQETKEQARREALRDDAKTLSQPGEDRAKVPLQESPEKSLRPQPPTPLPHPPGTKPPWIRDWTNWVIIAAVVLFVSEVPVASPKSNNIVLALGWVSFSLLIVGLVAKSVRWIRRRRRERRIPPTAG